MEGNRGNKTGPAGVPVSSGRILVVDDETSVRELTAKILGRAGYFCCTAADTAEARRHLERDHISLILCDIMMPGEDGISLVRHALRDYPDTAVIMVTAVGDPRAVETALDLGVYGYIIKPFSRNQVLICVANALRRRELELSERSYRRRLEENVRNRTAHLREKVRQLKRAQESLRQNEERFRLITASAKDAIVMINPEGVISLWNRSARRMLGYSEAETVGREFYRLIVPKRLHDPYAKAFRRFHQTGESPAMGKTLELPVLRKDGKEIPAEISFSAFRQNGGWNAIEIIRDISRRKEMEAALKESHRQMEELVAAIPSILISATLSGVITRWNRVAEETFGIDAGHALGRPLSECGAGWEWERIQKGLGDCAVSRKAVLLDDIRFTRHDGSEGFLGITLTPITDDADEPAGVLLMGADITKRKCLESQLAQAQKLESIGQLAAGIAHEINTPTQYIGDNTRFLQDAFSDLSRVLDAYGRLLEAAEAADVPEDVIRNVKAAIEAADVEYLMDEIPEAIRQSLQGIERVSKIVLSMKAFSHPGTEEKTAVDVNQALESTLTVARNEWKYVADVETDLDPALPMISCLPAELNQVFLNIIINAAHAIQEKIGSGSDEKGTIRVETRKNGDSVEIRVSDTGCGIPEKIRSRVFDPFFTTKEVGKGTGQGLAISHSVIVEKHGGSLTLESEEGKGTTFVITLPISGPEG